MSSQGAPRVVIDDTFGSAFIGALFTAMLYGITTLQTYFYYVHYPKDRFDTKILVFSIWILDTLHAALVSVCMYHYLVTNYANPRALATGHWSLFLSVLLNVVIACCVQTYFTVKIHHLCGPKVRWFISTFIGLIVLAHFAFGIETVVFLFIKKELAKLPDITLFAAMPFAVFAVLSDILIAGALCILLHGSKTGFEKTNMLISTLMVYAINRCLLTSVVAVVEVIVFAIAPHSLWFTAIDFVIGKLYANSLLATLNSRNHLMSNMPVMNTVPLSDIRFEDQTARTTATGTKGVVINLNPNKTTSSGSSGSQTLGLNDKYSNNYQLN